MNIEELKQVFKEQEEDEQKRDELKERYARARAELAEEKLRQAKLKNSPKNKSEELAQQLQEQDKKVRFNTIAYICTTAFGFLALLSSVILFIIILIKG